MIVICKNSLAFRGIDIYSSCHSRMEIKKKLFSDSHDFSKQNNQVLVLRKLTENIFKGHRKQKQNNSTRIRKYS